MVLCNVKANSLLTKHSLNCMQKCETWPDPGPGPGFLPWWHTFLQSYSQGKPHPGLERRFVTNVIWRKIPSWSSLTSCCLPLDNRPSSYQVLRTFSTLLLHLVNSVWWLTLHWRSITVPYSHHAWSPEAWSVDRTFANSAQNCWDTWLPSSSALWCNLSSFLQMQLGFWGHPLELCLRRTET